MTESMTTGTWIVSEDKEAAFFDAWASFAAWSSSMSGATTLRLGRDRADARRFVSFAAWDSADAVQAWKTMPEMQQRLAQVVQYVDDFHNEELVVTVTACDGSSTTAQPAGR